MKRLINRLIWELTRPAWIAVGDRMPDDEITVLAYAGSDIFMAYHCDGAWLTDEREREIRGVTHWMDLPEAPETPEALEERSRVLATSQWVDDFGPY